MLTEYRNKCEFSIATSSCTNQPVVGFRLGSYEEGEFTVVSADTCAHIPHRMKQLARVREDTCIYDGKGLLIAVTLY